MSADVFLDAEAGIETSQPREFYDINQTGIITYRIASGVRDIAYLGNTYVASPAARTDLTLSMTTADVNLTFSVPLAHPLVQRWMSSMSPPKDLTITIYRQQLGVATEVFFTGAAISMGFDRHVAKFTLQSTATRKWARNVGKFVSRNCTHFLYDAGCKVTRGFFGLTTTVTVIDGLRVTVATVAPLSHSGDTTYFPFGEFIHNASGERQTIFSQYGERVDLQAPIPGMKVGDSVTLYAGCDHTMPTCSGKFLNQANFFGFPVLPSHELFIPGNRLGVLSES